MKKRRGQYLEQEEKLLKYRKGQLSAPEREELEAALSESPTLQEQARLLKNISEVVENPNWLASAETLLSLKKEKLAELPDTTTTNLSNPSSIWQFVAKHKVKLLVATLSAVVLILLTVGNFLLVADCNQLYHRFLEPFVKVLPTTEQARPELVAAIAAYQSGLSSSRQNRRIFFAEALRHFRKVEDKEEIFQLYSVVSEMLSLNANIDSVAEKLESLKQMIEEEEEGNYLHLIDWIDYYEALIAFKRDQFHEGKTMIKEIAEREDLEEDLREIISPFRFQLRFLYMAK